MNGKKLFPGIESFLFDTPLYVSFDLSSQRDSAMALLKGHFKIDGFCKYCKRESPFNGCDSDLHPVSLAQFDTVDDIFALSIECTRCGRRFYFYVRKVGFDLMKIGQYPSLADISVEFIKEYTKVLGASDREDFHRAIGLAAHGVGIGAFVYLRRIFENLIEKRFRDHQISEGWTDEDFNRKRMNEKVAFLAPFLPKFLVDNSFVYSILSVGIHALEEESCRSHFDVIKESILAILEEDEAERRKRARLESIERALNKISSELASGKQKKGA